MLFEVRHVTEYRYDEPVRESVIELRMQPRKTGGQGLVSFDLEIEPGAEVLSYADIWGNEVHHFDIPHRHQRLEIVARSVVETYARAPLGEVAADEWARLDDEGVRGDCWDFLNPSLLAAPTEALRTFMAQSHLTAPQSSDPLTAIQTLSGVLFDAFDYEAGVTEPDSPINHALAEGRGVCQDFTHIMIAICRLWGVPARYMSGYLFTDREAHDRSGSGATHAWVEVYLPSLGWIGVDPTNNIMTAERHLAVAVGRDYADVPPSRGVFKGEAHSALAVGVSVRKADDRTAQPEFVRMGAPAMVARRRASALMEHQHQQQQQ